MTDLYGPLVAAFATVVATATPVIVGLVNKVITAKLDKVNEKLVELSKEVVFHSAALDAVVASVPWPSTVTKNIRLAMTRRNLDELYAVLKAI